MIIFILSLGIILMAILGLGAGILLGRGPLKGSCGGNEVIKLCSICRRETEN